jgi:hypothetical protein
MRTIHFPLKAKKRGPFVRERQRSITGTCRMPSRCDPATTSPEMTTTKVLPRWPRMYGQASRNQPTNLPPSSALQSPVAKEPRPSAAAPHARGAPAPRLGITHRDPLRPRPGRSRRGGRRLGGLAGEACGSEGRRRHGAGGKRD